MPEKNIQTFAADVTKLAGYVYTLGDRLSSRYANERLSRAVTQVCDLSGRKVIDVGCGDGTYTLQLLSQDPKYVLGIDASETAVEFAKKKFAHLRSRLQFRTVDIYDLEKLDQHFDIAIVRGVLHHLYEPERGIRALLAVANEVIVIEPNGYNVVLKAIEKLSRYHVEHEEKSYPPYRLRSWFGKNGGVLTRSFFAGLVPFFCYDWLARMLKVFEPWIERLPLLNKLACGVYVFKATRTGNASARLPANASDEIRKAS